MHQYSTTTKRKVNIPEDDGRSLLALHQYHLQLQEIGRLSVAQEHELVEIARQGNLQAREMLIESCLRYVYSLAWHYAKQHSESPEVMDLAQVGNEAVVCHLDESLKSRYTCAFLRLVARRAMSTFCIEDALIRVPRASFTRGRRAPLTVSLMTPLYDSDRTLLDLLEDADWQGVDACLEAAS